MWYSLATLECDESPWACREAHRYGLCSLPMSLWEHFGTETVLFSLFVSQDLLLVLTKLFEFQAISGVLGVLAGGVVTVMAALAFQGYVRAIALWHVSCLLLA